MWNGPNKKLMEGRSNTSRPLDPIVIGGDESLKSTPLKLVGKNRCGREDAWFEATPEATQRKEYVHIGRSRWEPLGSMQINLLLVLDGRRNIVCCNCCGATSGDFLREIKELRRHYSPCLLSSSSKRSA